MNKLTAKIGNYTLEATQQIDPNAWLVIETTNDAIINRYAVSGEHLMSVFEKMMENEGVLPTSTKVKWNNLDEPMFQSPKLDERMRQGKLP